MQCKAIFEAISELKKEKINQLSWDYDSLVSTESELKIMRSLVNRVADKIETQNKIKLDYIVGTMIDCLEQPFKRKIYQNMQIFLVLELMI